MRRVTRFLDLGLVDKILKSPELRSLHPELSRAAESRNSIQSPVSYRGCMGCGKRGYSPDTSFRTVSTILKSNPSILMSVERTLGIDKIIL
jgi:hypothetical protein